MNGGNIGKYGSNATQRGFVVEVSDDEQKLQQEGEETKNSEVEGLDNELTNLQLQISFLERGSRLSSGSERKTSGSVDKHGRIIEMDEKEHVEWLNQRIGEAERTVNQLKIEGLTQKLNRLKVEKDGLTEALGKVENKITGVENEINALKLRDNDDEVKEEKVDEFEIPPEIHHRITEAIGVFGRQLALVKGCRSNSSMRYSESFKSIVEGACNRLVTTISRINADCMLSKNTLDTLTETAYEHLESAYMEYDNGAPLVWCFLLEFTNKVINSIPGDNIGNNCEDTFLFNIFNKMQKFIVLITSP